MGRVEGKIAIVTGGGAGIGRATSMLLASEGAKVVVTQRNEEKGQQVVEEIEQGGGTALFVKQDISLEPDWQRVVNETVTAFGVPEILVNNAGIAILKSLSETTVEDWHHLMNINALGFFLGMKYCAALMADRGRGSIVNISSIAAQIGMAHIFPYNASKGAILSMTKDAAIELAPKNVRVNSVHPGVIDTSMADVLSAELGTSKEELGKAHPLGHIGEPIDVAYGVLFLASDESKFITGTELVIDGGYTAQ